MNKIKRSLTLTFAAVLLLLACCFSSAYASEKVWWIEPGKGIDWIKVGVTPAAGVIKQLGDKGTWNKQECALIYLHSHGMNFTYDPKSNKISSIMVMKPKSGGVVYKTRKGITINAGESAITKAYGKPATMDIIDKFHILTYTDGATFTSYITYKGQLFQIWLGQKTEYSAKIDMLKSDLRKVKN